MEQRILCLGDSNTFGYDPRSYLGEQYPEDTRWTGLLRAAGWEILNYGQNGLEIPACAQEFDGFRRLIRSEMPLDIVTVMLGSNDLLQHRGFLAEDAAARMEPFLRYLKERIPGCRFFLIAPPPMRPGEWVGERRLLVESHRLGLCYEALANRLGIPFADAGAWDVEMTFDGVHFSPAGHASFAKGLDRALRHAFRIGNVGRCF